MKLKFDPAEHVYEYDGKSVPSVTQILSSLGVSGKYNSNSPVVRNAALRGRCVHKIMELSSETHSKVDLLREYSEWVEKNGALPYSELGGYVDAGYSWLADRTPEVISCELMAGNELYAGTVDLVAEIDGETYVVDWKTSREVKDSHLYQIGGYCYLLGINHGMIVHLKEDGSYEEHKTTKKEVDTWSKLLGIFRSDLSDDDKRAAAKATINDSVYIDESLAVAYQESLADYKLAKERLDGIKEEIEKEIRTISGDGDASNDLMYVKWVAPGVTERIDLKRLIAHKDSLGKEEQKIIQTAIEKSRVVSTRKGSYRITMR